MFKITDEQREITNPRLWVYDIETFSNLFTAVFYNPKTDTTKKFLCHGLDHIVDDEYKSNLPELIKFLKTRVTLVGFNNLNFDGQVLEHIMRGKVETGIGIYEFAQRTIERLSADRWDVEYKEWHKTLTEVDLMSVMHFGIGTAKTTSLKWLMYTMRCRSMDDLPFDHTKSIETNSQVAAIMKYNVKDVDVTTEFYYKCYDDLDLRKGLYKDYSEKRIINMSEPSIASYLIKDILSKKYNVSTKKLKQMKTFRKEIVVADHITDMVNFKNDEFNEVMNHFKSKVLTADSTTGEISLKGKEVLGYNMEFKGITYEYGAGGLHASCKPSIWEETEDMAIVDLDFASYYPWLIILLKIYPEHFDEKFCDILLNLYKERKKYAKGTAKNKALKIVLNSIYGLFNNKYSPVYDPLCTIATTVNGQLILSMLVDRFTQIGEVIQVNTDGVTLYVPKTKLSLLQRSCRKFEKITGLTLEEVYYKKMVIRDVNNYLSVDTDGNVKRKGFFETYQDIAKGSLHKNPSAAIVPHALSEYFVKGVPIEETIYGHQNIHDFLIGIKKRRDFEYVGFEARDSVVEGFKRFEGRVLRYYVSSNGYNMFKHFVDGRKNSIQAVSKGVLTKPLQNIRSESFNYVSGAKKGQSKYSDLNYDWYINECDKLIETLENE